MFVRIIWLKRFSLFSQDFSQLYFFLPFFVPSWRPLQAIICLRARAYKRMFISYLPVYFSSLRVLGCARCISLGTGICELEIYQVGWIKKCYFRGKLLWYQLVLRLVRRIFQWFSGPVKYIQFFKRFRVQCIVQRKNNNKTLPKMNFRHFLAYFFLTTCRISEKKTLATPTRVLAPFFKIFNSTLFTFPYIRSDV